MRYFLATLLSLPLPFIVRWAQRQEALILENGFPLDDQGLRDAESLGVRERDRIRILLVDEIPFPGKAILKTAGAVTGLYSRETQGLSLRYGIFIRKDAYPSRQLVAHECVHTSQYERLGGFKPFLRQYLKECLVLGYPASPLEQEAILRTTRMP